MCHLALHAAAERPEEERAGPTLFGCGAARPTRLATRLRRKASTRRRHPTSRAGSLCQESNTNRAIGKDGDPDLLPMISTTAYVCWMEH